MQQVADGNVWRLPASGNAQPTRLLGSTLLDIDADYSPDGSRIAYCSDQTGSLEIWIAQSDGSRPAQLTSFGEGHSCGPRWSPDSKDVFDSNANSGFDIYMISADGGNRYV